MKKKPIEKLIIDENQEILDDFFILLEWYRNSFVQAKTRLDKEKNDWKQITLELLGDIFDEKNLAKMWLLEYLEKSSENKRSEYAKEIINEYENSSWDEKRALVDIKAYLINNGIS